MIRKRKSQPITPEVKEAILGLLREIPNITAVCDMVGMSTTKLRAYRKANPKFEAKVQEALEEGYDHLENEARRRAVEGWEEPVYFKGRQCGTVRKYSDQMLGLLLRGYRAKRFAPNAAAVNLQDAESVKIVLNMGGGDG